MQNIYQCDLLRVCLDIKSANGDSESFIAQPSGTKGNFASLREKDGKGEKAHEITSFPVFGALKIPRRITGPGKSDKTLAWPETHVETKQCIGLNQLGASKVSREVVKE